MDISVIVPIYKAEQYVERCLRSLFTQTKTDRVEFILVNDCSPDKSMEVAKRVIAEFPDLEVKILNNETNSGSGLTRARGISEAKGMYTIQIDSDDWCEPSMLEELYIKAKENDADIVYSNSYWEDYGNRENVYTEKFPNSKDEFWESFFVKGYFHTLWTKLIKRNLFSQEGEVFFFQGINNPDDFLASCKLFHYAKKIVPLPRAYIHYNLTNVSALTFNRTTINFLTQRYRALLEIEAFLRKQGYDDSVIDALIDIKLRYKYSLITITRGKQQKEFARIWPEVNDVFFSSSYRFSHKLIMWFAVNGMLFFSNVILGLIKLVKNR